MIAPGDYGDPAGLETGLCPKNKEKGNLMSEHYVSKALLFDEADMISEDGSEPQAFEELVEMWKEKIRSEFVSDYPTFQMLGVCSERFGRSDILSRNYRAKWVKTENGWSDTLSAVFYSLGDLEEDLIARFIESEDTNQLVSDVAEEIVEDIEAQDYRGAKERLSVLENLHDAGLPWFRNAFDLKTGGTDDAHDYRREDRGPGRRVIVEVAFIWG